jgi:hypothetical protein
MLQQNKEMAALSAPPPVERGDQGDPLLSPTTSSHTSSSAAGAVPAVKVPVPKPEIEHKEGGPPPRPSQTQSRTSKQKSLATRQSNAPVIPREFYVNDEKTNEQYQFPDNSVKTSRYTLLTFLPLNLFLQFKRIANFYFLVCVLLQMIPGVSPFSWWTITLPLVFILAVTAIKDAYEDIVSKCFSQTVFLNFVFEIYRFDIVKIDSRI